MFEVFTTICVVVTNVLLVVSNYGITAETRRERREHEAAKAANNR